MPKKILTLIRNAAVTFFNLVHIALAEFSKLIIIAMVLIIFANVVLRYVFNSGLFWSEEIALLIAVWFSFIAMAIGVKHRLHININIFPEKRIPKWFGTALAKFGFTVMLAVGFVMVRYGWPLVGFMMRSIMPATGWPTGIMYAVLPVAGILIIWDSITAILGIETRDAEVDRFLAGTGSLRDVIGADHVH